MGTWAIWKVLVKDSHLSLIETRPGLVPKISFRVYPLDCAELFPVQLFIGWIPGWTTQIWVSLTPGLGPHTSPGWPPHLVPQLAAHLLSPVAAYFFPLAFLGSVWILVFWMRREFYGQKCVGPAWVLQQTHISFPKFFVHISWSAQCSLPVTICFIGSFVEQL